MTSKFCCLCSDMPMISSLAFFRRLLAFLMRLAHTITMPRITRRTIITIERIRTSGLKNPASLSSGTAEVFEMASKSIAAIEYPCMVTDNPLIKSVYSAVFPRFTPIAYSIIPGSSINFSFLYLLLFLMMSSTE